MSYDYIALPSNDKGSASGAEPLVEVHTCSCVREISNHTLCAKWRTFNVWGGMSLGLK